MFNHRYRAPLVVPLYYEYSSTNTLTIQAVLLSIGEGSEPSSPLPPEIPRVYQLISSSTSGRSLARSRTTCTRVHDVFPQHPAIFFPLSRSKTRRLITIFDPLDKGFSTSPVFKYIYTYIYYAYTV